jgi:hypothetical protein
MIAADAPSDGGAGPVPNLIALGSAAVLLWGLIFEWSRVVGLPFADLLPVAACLGLALVAGGAWIIAGQVAAYRRDADSARLRRLAAVTVLALGFGLVRALDVPWGGDSLDYLAGPSWVARYPSEPLGFSPTPILDLGYEGVFGYWLPYTWEYLLAAWSRLTGIELPVLGYRVIPALACALALVLYVALLQAFGARGWWAPALAASLLAAGYLDGGANQAWGIMAFNRTYENKGLLFTLGLPATLLLTLVAARTPAPLNVGRLFLLSGAFTFVSANALYLIPAAGLALLAASRVGDRGLPRPPLAAMIPVVIALVALPAAMVVAIALVGGPSVYDFVDAENFGLREDKFWTYAGQLDAVFGHYHLTLWLALASGFAALLLTRSPMAKVVFWFGVLQVGVILFWPGFALLRALEVGEYRVLWRFFLLAPILLYLHLAAAAVVQRLRPLATVSVLVALGLAHYGLIFEPARSSAVKPLSPQTWEDFTRGHQSLDVYAADGIELEGEWVLASHQDAKLMPVLSPGVRMLIGEKYFMAWQGAATGRKDLARDLVRGQMLLDGRPADVTSEPYVAAFRRIVRRYRPRAIVLDLRGRPPEGREALIEAEGYAPGPHGRHWRMYLRIQP